jgi:uncharacterized protein
MEHQAPAECSECRYLTICGGGYLPHRFGSGNFNRKTVYCAEMFSLLDYIETDLREAAPSLFADA